MQRIEKRGAERIVLWRWSKPTKVLELEENPQWFMEKSGKRKKFRSHNRVVLAGLNPFDWMEIMKGEGIVLHKIVLNKQQAELCVVAEAEPSKEKIEEFIERKHIFLGLSGRRKYQEENYERSFVPLLEYLGGYDLPEVLIPFPVKAKVVSRIELLFIKLKMSVGF